MDKYEYKIVCTTRDGVPLVGPQDLPYDERLKAGLDQLGAEGWLLVAVIGGTRMIFARRTHNGT